MEGSPYRRASKPRIGAPVLLLVVVVAALLWGRSPWKSAMAASGRGTAVGLDWQNPVMVSANAQGGAFEPRLVAAPNGTLLIAFNHDVNGSKDLHYVLSSNGGNSWSAPASIYKSNNDSENLSIAFDNNNLAHAVWREAAATNQIRYAPRNKWQANQSSLVYQAPGAQSENYILLQPDIAVAPDRTLYVVWVQVAPAESGIQRDIWFASSSDEGASWSAPEALTDSSDSSEPSIVIDADGIVHLAWEESILQIDPGPPPTSFEVSEIRFISGSLARNRLNWSSPTVLSDLSGLDKAFNPSLEVEGNDLYLAFASQGESANTEQYAYYTHYAPSSGWSVPQDTTLDNPVGVNGVDPKYMRAALARCGGNSYVYYHGTFNQAENERIFGADKHSNWADVHEVNTGPSLTTRALNPHVYCGADMHMAFERVESQTDDHQIFYMLGKRTRQVYLPAVAGGK